ncbi:Gfo/Idh/MocA family protein [Oceanicoccus sp. KOV_DT_Chl]|uniref:Gfo/Idh/MocA family protein n=1 Tax=Oceanicoccus sp. KOV_DT_Chl TaxID=1904639 RepID=UPI001F39C9A1|nr:Gfo/Idh/MocA family oxidoreductase [Oceanicoccus sp. KOV_DT_Chl]
MRRKLRMGMVGGGEGAFIGAVHRMAANLDGQIDLVCGAFSHDPDCSLRSGQALYLPAERCYQSYQQMMQQEAALPEDVRMDFVVIVTPNHLHFPVAVEAIKYGFHVLSDKPATLNVEEVLELRSLIVDSGLLYGITQTYTGYPMVKEARARVQSGELGNIRKVVVEYTQGWLAAQQAEADNKQAAWRLDPKQAGISSCMADIGVHAFNLVEYISGLTAAALCADIGNVVAGRSMDDDGAVFLKFDQGARGTLLASQVAIGEENTLSIRLYGDKASLSWSHQDPNTLVIKYNDKPSLVLRTGGAVGSMANANTRLPAGHPEGYIEAFANLYRNFASQIQSRLLGETLSAQALDVPGIDEAVRGMVFIEQVVTAGNSETKWHVIPQH